MTTLASLALADPHYGYGYGLYGPGIAAHPGLATSYTHRSPQGIGKRSAEPEPHLYGQYAWPSVSGPYFTSTCWGCRGKRSADADAHGIINNVNRVSGLSPFPSYHSAWPGATVMVNHMGKRSADAEPEADADADAYYGYYGYGGHGYALPGHRFVYNFCFTIWHSFHI